LGPICEKNTIIFCKISKILIRKKKENSQILGIKKGRNFQRKKKEKNTGWAGT
jgi:hypothetical protein